MMFLNVWSTFLMFVLTTKVVALSNSRGNDGYKGDKVVSIDLSTDQAAKKMEGFLKRYSKDMVDIWSRGGKKCQVHIKGNVFKSLRDFCEKEKITMNVDFTDLKDAIDSEALMNGAPPSDGTFNYSRYNNFAEISAELFNLQNQYPHLVRVLTVGVSYENRPLWIVKISEGILENPYMQKPVVWIDGLIHAREWISAAVPMVMMKQLVSMYGKDPQITAQLRTNQYHIVPVFNPDGYEHSITVDRCWRKTRRILPNVNATANKLCVGVDANRNWDIMWGVTNASSDPCQNDYRGPQVESELCVKAYANILRWKRDLLKSYWTLHSFNQVLLFPNAYTTAVAHDNINIVKVALTFISSIRKPFNTLYGTFPAAQLFGETYGTAIDYVHDKLNLTYSYAVELRPSPVPGNPGFLLPASEINETALETLAAIMDSNDKIDQINQNKKRRKRR